MVYCIELQSFHFHRLEPDSNLCQSVPTKVKTRSITKVMEMKKKQLNLAIKTKMPLHLFLEKEITDIPEIL